MDLAGDSQTPVDMTVSSSTAASTADSAMQSKRMDKPVDSTQLKLLVNNDSMSKGRSVPMVVGDLTLSFASSFSLKSFLSCSKMASLAASCCSRVVILSLCCSVVTQWYIVIITQN